MKRISLVLAVAVIFSVSCKKIGNKAKLETNLDSVSYALGVNIGESMYKQNEKEFNAELIKQGYESMFDSSSAVKPEEALKLLQDYFMRKQKAVEEKTLKAGQEFLEKNKTVEGVVTLPSGLQYQVIKTGTGAMPKETDKVSVHYTGKLIDGTVFESTEGKEPASFPVNGVIKGWVEALQLMPVGSKWTLFIPSDLAYGINPRPGGPIEPNMALIFDIELLSIDKDVPNKDTKKIK
jgi:FKBP-type peptidyl-prolyl cis-trans isomerase FklB